MVYHLLTYDFEVKLILIVKINLITMYKKYACKNNTKL